MKALIALLAAFALVASANPLAGLSKSELEGKTWVVLVAGSDGYYNYRHQADVCHAYQVLHKMGVPEERIIVMMKDDIANSRSNPFPGQIFNEPGGPDVYAGVPHDYTGSLVTSSVFKSIMMGEEMTVGSKKSLRSGPDDNVFVFFDDHGSEGAMCFPRGCDLDANMMGGIINTMTEKKMYKRLVIYVETCFSGSVFYKLKLPPNVYVTTAAPVGESSFAYNYDTKVGAYLADVYSYLWIHDAEVNNGKTHTFQNQFDYIQDNIQGYSQTCQYGDKTIAKMTLNSFYAANDTRDNWMPYEPVDINDAVSAFDVPLETAKRVYLSHMTTENLNELNKQIAIKKAIDEMSEAIVKSAVPRSPHLGQPACKKCDSSCNCMRYCSGSKARCEFECCNERSCYEDPPRYGMNSPRNDKCVQMLVHEFLEACGTEHPYLRQTEALFRRICRKGDANIAAAINEIHAQCMDFHRKNF